jgi:hypothetical protein
MIDTAKIVDLALILIDASVGFEMQTFEYLTLLRVYYFIIKLVTRIPEHYGHTHTYGLF